MGKINYYQWLNGGCGCNGVRHISGTNDCDCDQILLEISNLHTDDEVLQDEIDDLSGDVATKLDASAYTPVDLTAYATKEWVNDKGYITTVQPLKTINGESIVGEGNITISGGSGTTVDAYTKAESDARFQPIGNYATEQWVLDKHYITGVDLSDYALKSDIDEIPTNVSTFINDANYVTISTLIQHIQSLTDELNSLKSTISGCCSQTPSETLYRWITLTGINDYWCDGTTKKTKEKEQSSNDGINWTDTGNIRNGSTVLEENCQECGGSGDTGLKSSIEIIGEGQKKLFVNKSNTIVETNEVFQYVSRSNLTHFATSSEVTQVESGALSGCTSLSAASFGNYSALEENQDPDCQLTSVGNYAFSGCSSLKYVEFEHCKTTVPTLGTGVFDGCTSLQTIYVRASMESAFKTAWPSLADKIVGI